MPAGPITPALPDLALSASLLTASLRRAGGEPSCAPPLALDLSEVRFLTAAGLGQLVALHNRLRAMGGRLVLFNVGEAAHEAIRAACLTDLLGVKPKGERGT